MYIENKSTDTAVTLTEDGSKSRTFGSLSRLSYFTLPDRNNDCVYLKTDNIDGWNSVNLTTGAPSKINATRPIRVVTKVNYVLE